MVLRAYSILYREKGESFEADPTYRYDCFICGAVIRGPRKDGRLHLEGQQVVNVLKRGQTFTVHARCNRSR